MEEQKVDDLVTLEEGLAKQQEAFNAVLASPLVSFIPRTVEFAALYIKESPAIRTREEMAQFDQFIEAVSAPKELTHAPEGGKATHPMAIKLVVFEEVLRHMCKNK